MIVIRSVGAYYDPAYPFFSTDLRLRGSIAMKAADFDTFGSPDRLEVREADTPSPKENEVLLKVHAASINSWDLDILKGTPFANRPNRWPNVWVPK